MKFTATALAFLGAASLVTAAPVNLTSTNFPVMPKCDPWTDSHCYMHEQYVSRFS